MPRKFGVQQQVGALHQSCCFHTTAQRSCSLQQQHNNPVTLNLAPSMSLVHLKRRHGSNQNMCQEKMTHVWPVGINMCTSLERPHRKAHCRLPSKEAWEACQDLTCRHQAIHQGTQCDLVASPLNYCKPLYCLTEALRMHSARCQCTRQIATPFCQANTV